MKKALIITDIQSDFLANMDYMVPVCQEYLDKSGSGYDLVVLTHWKHQENENENTLMLSYPNATIIEKRGYSAYNDELKKVLADNNIDLIHLAGIDSDMTVLATLYNLLDAGYQVQVLEQLLASHSTRNWEATTIMRYVIGDENVLQLGRKNVWV